MECCFRAKKIFSKIDCELLLCANLTKLIGSLYLTQKGKTHFQIKYTFESHALRKIMR